MLERYHRELLNFLYHQVNDHEVAADLAQESFVRVLAVQSAGQVVLDMRAMLFCIARRLLIDLHRRARHRQHEDIDTLDEVDLPSQPQYSQPEEVLAYEQQVRLLIAVIESLPPRCREAFVLSRFEGLSHQEVALQMGISISMVAQHVARGLRVCKDRLMPLDYQG